MPSIGMCISRPVDEAASSLCSHDLALVPGTTRAAAAANESRFRQVVTGAEQSNGEPTGREQAQNKWPGTDQYFGRKFIFPAAPVARGGQPHLIAPHCAIISFRQGAAFHQRYRVLEQSNMESSSSSDDMHGMLCICKAALTYLSAHKLCQNRLEVESGAGDEQTPHLEKPALEFQMLRRSGLYAMACSVEKSHRHSSGANNSCFSGVSLQARGCTLGRLSTLLSRPIVPRVLAHHISFACDITACRIRRN